MRRLHEESFTLLHANPGPGTYRSMDSLSELDLETGVTMPTATRFRAKLLETVGSAVMGRGRFVGKSTGVRRPWLVSWDFIVLAIGIAEM